MLQDKHHDSGEDDHQTDDQHDQVCFVAGALLVDFGGLVGINHDLESLSDMVSIGNVSLGEVAGIFLPINRVGNGRNIFRRPDIISVLHLLFDSGDGGGGTLSAAPGFDRPPDDVDH